MCLTTMYSWDRCRKKEVRHRICLAHIERTRTQNWDGKDCPDLRNSWQRLESKICSCRYDNEPCERVTWAIAGDGNQSWMFEVEDGKSWDDLNEAKKKLKQEEEELASGVSGQKPPKRMKQNDWDEGVEQENYEGLPRSKRQKRREREARRDARREREERHERRNNNRHYGSGSDYGRLRPDEEADDFPRKIKVEEDVDEGGVEVYKSPEIKLEEDEEMDV